MQGALLCERSAYRQDVLRLLHRTKRFGQALGLLVPVSSTRYRAYTSGLSTR